MDDLFIQALKAKLPLIAVETDDLVNVRTVIETLAKKKALAMPTTKSETIGEAYVYLTTKMELATVETYLKMTEAHTSCIFINPGKDESNLMFAAGILPTPKSYHRSYLKEFVKPELMDPICAALQGLSLKRAQEICRITMVRTGSLVPKDIRHTRMSLGGALPGLTPLDTDYDFYVMPQVLADWVAINDKYFLDMTIPDKLAPRGLMLKGQPGTGKSMAAAVLAKHWDVPLFRLDVATTMNRFQGESEARWARNMEMIEANSPCVYLMDEVEKLFGDMSGGEGTPGRLLSQSLWWLQNRKGRILTVMTSNNLANVPKELYRPGRIDKEIEIPGLSLSEAKIFASGVYQAICEKAAPLRRQKVMREALEKLDMPTMSQAFVTEMVYELIKGKSWLREEKQQQSLMAV